MKLEVGMYLRYEGLDSDFPIIQKIIDLEIPGRCGAKYKVFTDKTNGWFIDSDYIEMAIESSEIPQPSFNIIDILEIGDYVNGSEILGFENEYIEEDDKFIPFGVITENCYLDNNKSWIIEKDIKSVITHEQMEQMTYKVGE